MAKRYTFIPSLTWVPPMETAASTRKGWPVKVSGGGGEGERRERGGRGEGERRGEKGLGRKKGGSEEGVQGEGRGDE